MLKEKADTLRQINIVLDMLITVLSFLLAYAVRSLLSPTLSSTPGLLKYLPILYFALPLWYLLLNLNTMYDSQRIHSLPRVSWGIIKAVSCGIALIIIAGYLLRLHWMGRAFVLLFGAFNVVLLVGERVAVHQVLHYIRRKGLNFRTVLVVGTGDRAKAVARKIRANKSWGLHIFGFLAQDPSEVGQYVEGKKVLGTVEEFQRIISSHPIDEVHIALPLLNLDKISRLLELSEEQGIKARVMIDLYVPTISKLHLEDLQGTPMLTFTATPKENWQMLIKQSIDTVGAFILLILVLPLFLLIAILIKLDSKGPVFFLQERIGLQKRRFKMYKFRTMVEDAEKLKPSLMPLNELSGPMFKMKNDPRRTRMGRLLRETSLDELPQLINVLKGEMSFIGPRPPLPEEVELYENWQYRRLSMKPGISGLWQVSGRNNTDFQRLIELDLQYIDNWSLKLDLLIFLKTLPVVFSGRGAF